MHATKAPRFLASSPNVLRSGFEGFISFIDLSLQMSENWDDPSMPAAAPVADVEVKLFGKWSSEDVQVGDISLAVSEYVFSSRTCRFECQKLTFTYKSGLFVYLNCNRIKLCVMFTGLHCRERQIREIPASFSWSLPSETLPQGPVPHCGASHQLPDDAWP